MVLTPWGCRGPEYDVLGASLCGTLSLVDLTNRRIDVVALVAIVQPPVSAHLCCSPYPKDCRWSERLVVEVLEDDSFSGQPFQNSSFEGGACTEVPLLGWKDL